SILTLDWILSAEYIFNTVLILSLFVVWKFLLAQKYLMESIPKSHMVLVSLLLLGLMFYFPVYVPGIDGSKLYLGKFTPTIWHNSTTIFAFAFSVLMFLKSIKYVEDPNNKSLLVLFLLGMLVLISKPSFLFVFIPCFPIVFAVKHQIWNINLLKITVLCGIFLIGLFGLKWVIYTNSA